MVEVILTPMFPIQKQLDDHILDKFPELRQEDLFDKRVLSLQIELGELANELPEVFKFWSHKKNNYELALEEYVDCLHFILSIGNAIGYKSVTDISSGYQSNTVEAFIELQAVIFDTRMAYHNKQEDLMQRHYERLLMQFARLGELIGFSWSQIEQAYYDKNKENYKRQANGY